MKKTIVKTFLVFILVNTAGGCKKFITKDLVGQYPESQFYQTEAQAGKQH